MPAAASDAMPAAAPDAADGRKLPRRRAPSCAPAPSAPRAGSNAVSGVRPVPFRGIMAGIRYRDEQEGIAVWTRTSWGRRSPRCARRTTSRAQDLADRCRMRPAGHRGPGARARCRPRSRRSSRSRARWACAWARSWTTTRTWAPPTSTSSRWREVERTKSLETTSGGDLSYFSLAAGRPSRHMDPFVITVDPRGEADHELVGHEGEEWLYGMEGEHRDRVRQGDLRAPSRREHLLRLHRAAPGARSRRPEGEVPRRRLHPDLREAT